jgi:hypothetical protein
LVRLLLARELDRLDAFQRLLPVSGTKQHESLMGLSPAMAAISARSLWSMTDLAEMIDASFPKCGPRGPYKRVA